MSEHHPGTDEALVASLRSGDESAFAALVDDLHGGLLGFASTFTSSPALAEDIVQETWLAVIRGLHGFEGRSSLRTWIFSILVRRARTMATREARHADPPLRAGGTNGGGLVEWEPGQGRRGLWEEAPVPWALEDPAAIQQSREALDVLTAALDGLPAAQRQVVLLRDVEGLPAGDACNVLELSETNQRVLLHRGRARLRRALDHYLRDGTRPKTPARAGAARTDAARGDAMAPKAANPGARQAAGPPEAGGGVR